jgi:hypothetical protein
MFSEYLQKTDVVSTGNVSFAYLTLITNQVQQMNYRSLSTVLETTPKTRQAMYVQRNIEAHSCTNIVAVEKQKVLHILSVCL